MKKLYVLMIFMLILITEKAQAEFNPVKLLNSMTLTQKAGQLFLIRPDQLDTTQTPNEIHDSKRPGIKSLTPEILDTLKQYPAGGFVIFAKNIDTPEQLKALNKSLKDSSKIFPVIAVDEEGGRISRLANSKGFKLRKFESTESIGRTRNPKKAREAASYIASYLKEYGFNMNFAPVADINTNPENIVIGDRAFGSDPELVSSMVSAYLDGLHEHNIAGSIKHFPGHGDTKDDTHSGYVAVYKTWNELLKAEIIPFRENLKKADSVMTAHITMKNVTSDDLPATLSNELVTGKLRNELGYNGVVIADSMMMGAIKENYTSSEAAVMALEAGCDVILMPYDYIEAFNGVVDAVKSGRISEQRLNQSVMRILMMKRNMQEAE